MNGTLAALIDLALRANAWLAAGGDSPPPDLLPHDDTFKYVKSVSTIQPSVLRLPQKSADGTAAWLRALRKLGVQHVRLVFAEGQGELSPRVASAFANGGGWGLLSDGPKSMLWVARWEVGNRDDPDRRIWNVAISGERSDLHADLPDVRSSTTELRIALSELGDFAAHHAQQSWADVMQAAQDQLVADDPKCAYYPEMVPAGALPLDRLQLLAAATHGWIFGGMGSWNDNFVSVDIDEHERLCANLWNALTAAMAAAVNS